MPVGQGLPDGKATASAPGATTSREPIMPSIMWVRRWQCMCHSPNGGSDRINESGLIVKTKGVAISVMQSTGPACANAYLAPKWSATVAADKAVS